MSPFYARDPELRGWPARHTKMRVERTGKQWERSDQRRHAIRRSLRRDRLRQKAVARLEADPRVKLHDTACQGDTNERAVWSRLWSDSPNDRAESTSGNVIQWHVEVRMIEDVVESGSNPKTQLFCEFEILQQV